MSQIMNQSQLLMMNHQPQMMMMIMINQNQQPLLMNQQPPLMNQSQLGIDGSYGMRVHQHDAKPKSNSNTMKYQPNYSGNKWKGRKGIRNGIIGGSRSDRYKNVANSVTKNVIDGGCKLPSNQLKARKVYPKKRFNSNNRRIYAPRNTTSFIIRSKKSGGIASIISPCSVTPAVLPTPVFSPSREVLGDMAREEWGVDGYGSMKGLIRRRNESEMNDDEDEDEDGALSDSGDVEEHVEVERRLDHDLSRFEMIYPNADNNDNNNVLENSVYDQDSHIAQLEEENFTLKERLFFMERDLGDLRRRLQCLENQNQNQNMFDANNELVVENGSNLESGNNEEASEHVACDEGSCAEVVVSEGNDVEVDPFLFAVE